MITKDGEVQDRRTAKQETISGVESHINYALLVWGEDDMIVRKILLECRRNLRQHLEGAKT